VSASHPEIWTGDYHKPSFFFHRFTEMPLAGELGGFGTPSPDTGGTVRHMSSILVAAPVGGHFA